MRTKYLLLKVLVCVALCAPVAISTVSLVGCSGCAQLDPGADPIEVRAEQSISLAADTLDTFQRLEMDNRTLILEKAPAVHKFAEYLREPVTVNGKVWPRGLGMVESATVVRRAYKANRTPENKANLASALAALDALVKQTQQQLTVAKGVK